jgi:hypothetical protein
MTARVRSSERVRRPRRFTIRRGVRLGSPASAGKARVQRANASDVDSGVNVAVGFE